MINKLRLALYEPRIPQNTGNIARTCAAFNITLDLIFPIGFSLEDKYLKRAGLDYWKYLDINTHVDFQMFYNTIGQSRLIGFSKKADVEISDVKFQQNDILLLGREDTGLPNNISQKCTYMSKISMPGGVDKYNTNGVRSLNLSVACGIVAYQANKDLKIQ